MLDRGEYRWLLNVVDHLPRDSAYMQAITDDEQWAEQVLAAPEPERKAPAVRMADWSPELEMLTNLLDAVRELTRVTAMVAGAKPKAPKPAPRPRTAIDRVRERTRDEKHRSVVARMLPHKAGQPPPSS